MGRGVPFMLSTLESTIFMASVDGPQLLFFSLEEELRSINSCGVVFTNLHCLSFILSAIYRAEVVRGGIRAIDSKIRVQ